MLAVAIKTLNRIRLNGGPLQRVLQLTDFEGSLQRWRANEHSQEHDRDGHSAIYVGNRQFHVNETNGVFSPWAPLLRPTSRQSLNFSSSDFIAARPSSNFE